jgi:hypothetical protein
LIALIRDKTPPKNYIKRRASKVQDDSIGHAVKEYDEFAMFELKLRQFIDDISAN